MHPKDNKDSYDALKLKLIFNLLTLVITSVTGLIGLYMVVNYRVIQILNLTAMEFTALVLGTCGILVLRKSPNSQLPQQYQSYHDNYLTPSCNYPHCKKDATDVH